jgi:hypothetical protein
MAFIRPNTTPFSEGVEINLPILSTRKRREFYTS